jgi:hypothetical protein
MTPHWTPELVTKSPIEDFAVYEDRIYAIFRHDFIDSHPSFDGLRVSVRRQKEETDGKWAGFFHIPASKTTQPARGMSICVDVSGSGFHGRRLTTQRIVRNAIMRYVMRH